MSADTRNQFFSYTSHRRGRQNGTCSCLIGGCLYSMVNMHDRNVPSFILGKAGRRCPSCTRPDGRLPGARAYAPRNIWTAALRHRILSLRPPPLVPYNHARAKSENQSAYTCARSTAPSVLSPLFPLSGRAEAIAGAEPCTRAATPPPAPRRQRLPNAVALRDGVLLLAFLPPPASPVSAALRVRVVLFSTRALPRHRILLARWRACAKRHALFSPSPLAYSRSDCRQALCPPLLSTSTAPSCCARHSAVRTAVASLCTPRPLLAIASALWQTI